MTNNSFNSSAGAFTINILFILSTYKVVIEIHNNCQLDLRNTALGNLIGFDKKVITSTE